LYIVDSTATAANPKIPAAPDADKRPAPSEQEGISMPDYDQLVPSEQEEPFEERDDDGLSHEWLSYQPEHGDQQTIPDFGFEQQDVVHEQHEMEEPLSYSQPLESSHPPVYEPIANGFHAQPYPVDESQSFVHDHSHLPCFYFHPESAPAPMARLPPVHRVLPVRRRRLIPGQCVYGAGC
jgi:hypothetical protein